MAIFKNERYNQTMKGYIYKATVRENNKIYIGQTIQKTNKRWYQHFAQSKHRLKINKSLSHWDNACLLYTRDGIDFLILEEIENENRKNLILDLNILEIKYIELNKSCDSQYGYNTLKGGFSQIPEKDRLDKMTERMSGSKNPMYGIRGNNHPSFGHHRTNEVKESISIGNTGKIRTAQTILKLKIAQSKYITSRTIIGYSKSKTKSKTTINKCNRCSYVWETESRNFKPNMYCINCKDNLYVG